MEIIENYCLNDIFPNITCRIVTVISTVWLFCLLWISKTCHYDSFCDRDFQVP